MTAVLAFLTVVFTVLRTIKAPWAFGLVAMSTTVAMYMVIHTGLGVPSAAYQFAAVLIGGFVSLALLAAGVGTMRVMSLLVACTLLLIVSVVNFTPDNIFKDKTLEGLFTATAGGLVVLIKAVLERHRE